jgi:GrpB-like predicted nucleotidyltransferase (UPF0157 family)
VTTDGEITRHSDFDPAAVIWVADRPPAAPAAPVVIVDPDPSWPARYAELAGRIRDALGDAVRALDHVGSTSVPDLPAKPIIDIDLTVADAAAEAAYVPALEAAGFRLQLREPAWHDHRLLVADEPAANLHVWSPGSPEVIRHRMFRDWLADHADDRARYAAAKQAAAAATYAARRAAPAADSVMAYNRHKQAVIREILDRLFEAHHMS